MQLYYVNDYEWKFLVRYSSNEFYLVDHCMEMYFKMFLSHIVYVDAGKEDRAVGSVMFMYLLMSHKSMWITAFMCRTQHNKYIMRNHLVLSEDCSLGASTLLCLLSTFGDAYLIWTDINNFNATCSIAMMSSESLFFFVFFVVWSCQLLSHWIFSS